MKKLPAVKCLSHLIVAALLTLSSSPVLNAQSITSPSTAEAVIQGATLVGGVNCDMVQAPLHGFKSMKAVVWDDAPTFFSPWTSYLFVEYDGTSFPIATINDARFPDVVIGDHGGFPGDIYVISVIYLDQSGPVSTVKIQTYSIDVSASTPVLTTGPLPTSISNGVDVAEIPHIDLFSDATKMIGIIKPCPALQKYVATWTYNYASTGGGMEIMGAIGDINLLTPTTFSVCTTGRTPDVAACTDATGKQTACFVYGNGEVVEWNVNTIPYQSSGVFPFTASPTGYGFRIEAMSQYDGSSAKWTAITWDGTNTYVMSDLVTSTDCSSGLVAVPPKKTSYGPFTFPVVAAGVGAITSAGAIGNYQYTLGWYDALNNIYSQDVQKTTGLPSSAPDYYQVNLGAVTSASLGRCSNIAMSSSSNSGVGILSAFFNGSNIVYKVTSTTGYDFKPTSIGDEALARFDVYPNPASDRLFVTSAEGASYRVIDVTGRTLKSGLVDKTAGIDLAEMTTGMYLLELSLDGQKQTTRFVKE